MRLTLWDEMHRGVVTDHITFARICMSTLNFSNVEVAYIAEQVKDVPNMELGDAATWELLALLPHPNISSWVVACCKDARLIEGVLSGDNSLNIDEHVYLGCDRYDSTRFAARIENATDDASHWPFVKLLLQYHPDLELYTGVDSRGIWYTYPIRELPKGRYGEWRHILREYECGPSTKSAAKR